MKYLFLIITCGFPFFAIAQKDNDEKRGVELRSNNPKDSLFHSYYKEKHALIIGLSKYTGLSSLPGAEKDADTINEVLIRHNFNTTLLKNPGSAALLMDTFETVLKKASINRDNCLLIYFAGHGKIDEKDAYLVVPDSSKANGIELVDMERIFYYIRKSESPKHILIVLDGCFLGKASKHIFQGSNSIPPYIEAKLSKPAKYILTSSTSEQEVPDRSIFRDYFIKGISGEADAFGGDGYITLTELKAYMEEKITNKSRGAQIIFLGQILSKSQLENPDLAYGEFIFEIPKMH